MIILITLIRFVSYVCLAGGLLNLQIFEWRLWVRGEYNPLHTIVTALLLGIGLAGLAAVRIW